MTATRKPASDPIGNRGRKTKRVVGPSLFDGLEPPSAPTAAAESAPGPILNYDWQAALARLRLDRPLVVFDLETTGTELDLDRIVQFALIKVHPDRRLETWSELVNPGIPIPPGATAVHHLTDDQVRGKPPLAAFAARLRDFLAGCDLAGYNLHQFDLPLLAAELERAGVALPLDGVRIVDACVIFKQRERRTLEAAHRFYCGETFTGAHDALADTRATLNVLAGELARYPDLPGGLAELHEYCRPLPREVDRSRWVTADRWLRWEGDEAVFYYSKHKGKRLREVATRDGGFLRWLAGKEDFSSELRAIAAAALRGVFPKKPEAPTTGGGQPGG